MPKKLRTYNLPPTTYNLPPRTGFTLLELIVYLAIISVIAVSFTSYTISITNTRTKTYVAQEVHANARAALETMSQRIQAATGVNIGASTFGVDPGVLSLIMADATKNPTILDLTANDGRLRIKEGSAGAVELTSNEVSVTNLVFTNLTPAGVPRENIRIQMTMQYNNPGSNVHYSYSKAFQTTVSVRQ